MALKGDRRVEATLMNFFMNQVGEKGGIVSLVTTTVGSGSMTDQGAALVQYNATSSGVYPIAMLLSDVVSIDQTRQHRNYHKDEVQIGGKPSLAQRGAFVTNMTSGTVTGGTPAYLAPYGRLSSLNYQNGSPIVGRFLGQKDQDGYVRVEMNLPMATPIQTNTATTFI